MKGCIDCVSMWVCAGHHIYYFSHNQGQSREEPCETDSKLRNKRRRFFIQQVTSLKLLAKGVDTNHSRVRKYSSSQRLGRHLWKVSRTLLLFSHPPCDWSLLEAGYRAGVTLSLKQKSISAIFRRI